MQYGAADGALTDRGFDCYGLAWRGGCWYAVGHCHLRAALRSFRVDGVRSVAPIGVTFLLPVDFDAVRHLALGLARIPRTHQLLVRLRTDMDTARRELFDAIGQPVGMVEQFFQLRRSRLACRPGRSICRRGYTSAGSSC